MKLGFLNIFTCNHFTGTNDGLLVLAKHHKKPVGEEKLRDYRAERVPTADSERLRDDPVLYSLRWTKVF